MLLYFEVIILYFYTWTCEVKSGAIKFLDEDTSFSPVTQDPPLTFERVSVKTIERTHRLLPPGRPDPFRIIRGPDFSNRTNLFNFQKTSKEFSSNRKTTFAEVQPHRTNKTSQEPGQPLPIPSKPQTIIQKVEDLDLLPTNQNFHPNINIVDEHSERSSSTKALLIPVTTQRTKHSSLLPQNFTGANSEKSLDKLTETFIEKVSEKQFKIDSIIANRKPKNEKLDKIHRDHKEKLVLTPKSVSNLEQKEHAAIGEIPTSIISPMKNIESGRMLFSLPDSKEPKNKQLLNSFPNVKSSNVVVTNDPTANGLFPIVDSPTISPPHNKEKNHLNKPRVKFPKHKENLEIEKSKLSMAFILPLNETSQTNFQIFRDNESTILPVMQMQKDAIFFNPLFSMKSSKISKKISNQIPLIQPTSSKTIPLLFYRQNSTRKHRQKSLITDKLRNILIAELKANLSKLVLPTILPVSVSQDVTLTQAQRRNPGSKIQTSLPVNQNIFRMRDQKKSGGVHVEIKPHSKSLVKPPIPNENQSETIKLVNPLFNGSTNHGTTSHHSHPTHDSNQPDMELCNKSTAKIRKHSSVNLSANIPIMDVHTKLSACPKLYDDVTLTCSVDHPNINANNMVSNQIPYLLLTLFYLYLLGSRI